MRVIAGIYRGRILKEPISDEVRPTIDRVKEAVFGSTHRSRKNNFHGISCH